GLHMADGPCHGTRLPGRPVLGFPLYRAGLMVDRLCRHALRPGEEASASCLSAHKSSYSPLPETKPSTTGWRTIFSTLLRAESSPRMARSARRARLRRLLMVP